MPRPRRARQPREPKAPVTYAISPDIELVIAKLVGGNAVQFGWLNNFKVGGVLISGSKAKDTGGCQAIGRFVQLTQYSVVVVIQGWAWDRLDATGREALTAHLLCHGSMSEKGALRLEKHDLSEFHFVAAGPSSRRAQPARDAPGPVTSAPGASGRRVGRRAIGPARQSTTPTRRAPGDERCTTTPGRRPQWWTDEGPNHCLVDRATETTLDTGAAYTTDTEGRSMSLSEHDHALARAMDTRLVTPVLDDRVAYTTDAEDSPMDPSEHVQREHELLEAYKAAQRLAELLEMAGLDPAPARAIRDSLSGGGTDVEQTVQPPRAVGDKFDIPQQRDQPVIVVPWPPYPSDID